MKIAMLISGGVDSSVALALLKEQNYDITAFYLKIWLEEELSFLGECPWEEDLSYVSEICKNWDVPLEIISLQREYYDRVVQYTISELKAGRTPSPDLFCNQRIKFGAFYDKVGHHFDKIATGHYARTEQKEEFTLLKTSPDELKDQTYFLAHLSQEQVKRALFPIGNLPKMQVRELAQKYDLPNKNRKDSQGICFLGKIKYNDFTGYHLGNKSGDIVEWSTQKKLGTHKGFWFHTIGQRKGLGLSGGPWFVVKKDVLKNIVYVSRDKYEASESRCEFSVANFNWIALPPTSDCDLKVKIRHGKEYYQCTLAISADNTGKVVLDKPDPGIAAGQYAVFYNDDICLGCASIQ